MTTGTPKKTIKFVREVQVNKRNIDPALNINIFQYILQLVPMKQLLSVVHCC